LESERFMKILAIIPARGGSKGVPGKNIKSLDGKPLITYTIEAAKESSLISDIVVSTDDADIAKVCATMGVRVVERPDEIAGDQSMVMDAVRHTLDVLSTENSHYNLFVLLEPTAPLRTGDDIDQTIQILQKNNADSAATFSETDTPPTRIWKIEHQSPVPFIEGANPFLPRQQQATGYFLNGMVYVMKTEMLNKHPDTTSFLIGKTTAHIIPRNKVIDIDTEMDFLIAEQMMKAKK